ncbi:MAG: PH domain-containing protein, partial [Candidatus Kariarchaeaceae archaeon]
MKYENDNYAVFRPLSAFRNKLFLYNITVFLVITTGIVLFSLFMNFVIGIDGEESKEFTTFIINNGTFLWTTYFTLSFIIMLSAAILTVFYVRGIEYQIGEREVIVKKGIINKMEKHIPFRTITNISSRYGVYDRIFGIGTVQIETAGKSGQQTGPEEKIEGIANYFEVRDEVLDVLRQFRHQYATTTETPEDALVEPVKTSSSFEK